SRPQISPTVRGRKGSGCLREEANSPSAESTRLSCSSRARSSPRPTGRMSSASSWRLPRLVQNVGFAWTTTRAPGTGSTGRARSTCSRTGTEKDMSTSTSRRVMKLSPAPGRRLSWTVSPSTHSGASRATYAPTFTDSWRSGPGCSAVVGAAVGASAGRGTAAPPASGSGEVCVMAPLWHDRPTACGRRSAGVDARALWRDGESYPTALPPGRFRSYDGRREHRNRPSCRTARLLRGSRPGRRRRRTRPGALRRDDLRAPRDRPQQVRGGPSEGEGRRVRRGGRRDPRGLAGHLLRPRHLPEG